MTHEIIHSLFNAYTEIHAAQLGVLLGLLVGLSYRDHAPLAHGLLFTGVVLAFGNATAIGFGDIAQKPWYFLGGVYVASVVAMLATHVLQYYRQRRSSSVSSHN